MAEENNYVVGRGKLFFGQFAAGTKKPSGQKYFGNTPELAISQSEETLDHYSAEEGVRTKDASVTLQNDTTGTFTCDNINDDNLALWFRGITAESIEAGTAYGTGTVTFSTAAPSDGDSVTINGTEITFVDSDPVGYQIVTPATIGETATALANFLNDHPALGVTATANAAVTTIKSIYPGSAGNDITLTKDGDNIAVSGATLAGGTDATETLDNVKRGMHYQLGVTAETPQGLRGIGDVTITGVDADNYTVEKDTGRIYIHDDADMIVDGDDLEVAYGVVPATTNIVIAKGETIEGELAFFSKNAAGQQRDYFWPYVKLTSDGDFALKGDDWQTMGFSFEVLKRDSATERQYITKRN